MQISQNILRYLGGHFQHLLTPMLGQSDHILGVLNITSLNITQILVLIGIY